MGGSALAWVPDKALARVAELKAKVREGKTGP
jgi:hypothetical protein